MKTRIIYTDIWDDNWFQGLSDDSQKLFIFCITNDKIGMTGMYQLPDHVISAYTRLVGKKLVDAKLRIFPKVLFVDGWVKVVNASRYNPYKGGKNEVAYEKELLDVPESIRGYSIEKKDIVYPLVADTPINHKSETIIQKSEIKSFGESENLLAGQQTVPAVTSPGRDDRGLSEFIEHYNSVFGTKYKPVAPLVKNFEFWLGQYGLEDLKEAVRKAKYHSFWKDKLTPERLLRQKDQKGETCDRIGEMLNQKEVYKRPDALLEISQQLYGSGNTNE